MIEIVKKRLELKIIISLIAVLCCIIGIFTYADIRTMRADTIRDSEQNLGALARSVKESVAAAMRKQHQDEVQHIIEGVQNTFGVAGIVIYNEEGKALRRTGTERNGKEPDLPIPPQILHTVSDRDHADIQRRNGIYYLSYYSPIANLSECITCHGDQNKLNGILRIDFSLQDREKLIASRRNTILIWSAFMIAALIVALMILLRVVVYRPVRELRDAMVRAESGEEKVLLSTAGDDELSDLKRRFVSMLDRINALHAANLEKEKEIARNQEIMRFRAELQTMFDAMPEGVLLIDGDLKIVQINPRAYELLPWLKTAAGRIPPERTKKSSCPHKGIPEAFEEGKMFEHQCSIKLPDGTVRHLHSICAPILEDGRVLYVVEVIRDITERVKTERELEEKKSELLAANRLLSQVAITDSLTQVYNRHHFDGLLHKEIKRLTRRKYSHLSLMMIDIDHFKKLNDRYGHLTGDAVLSEVAKVLKEHIRTTDTIARYGGEEFAIVMPDTHLEGAVYRAEVLRKTIENTEFQGHYGSIRITISIGVAVYSVGSPRDFVAMADQALYQAKDSGRNAVAASRTEDVATL
ncbi:MAG TPA: diguanylate cyclase [Nitrospirota bacterium]|nr:diguanylate cyclase [Nitrospirota bacterium]